MSSSSSSSQIAIFFDLMGTCCDWLSSLLPLLLSLPPHPSLQTLGPNPRISHDALVSLALAWRAGFFAEIHGRFERREGAEDIDVTHRRVLDRLLEERGVGIEAWDEEMRTRLVQQWHQQIPWPDVIPALELLRARGNVFLVVLANGTTRLQLDIAQSSLIPFHTLLSSELLGLTKPDSMMYLKAIDLVKLPPDRCVMLASHLYDLEAAKGAGIRTVYVRRDTEDVGIEIEKELAKGYVDFSCDGRGVREAEQRNGGFRDAVHWIEKVYEKIS
ncbi:haloacid dehalogenase [Dendryphion nanum]|uniref:Haloacid dehalogenase n=1 Tax=Dendryphion nanum TaxID=256645 RepID=A0A9P9D4H0_9PLEO|nr:haloacid dehalogenase [Dendryphion nanum]